MVFLHHVLMKVGSIEDRVRQDGQIPSYKEGRLQSGGGPHDRSAAPTSPPSWLPFLP